jgi:type I restriction enzyme, R subunit
MDKRALSERDICTKFITPAIKRAGWDEMLQIREEVGFTKGRIIVRGKLVTRGKAKRADYVLYYKPNIPIALIEAKDNNRSVGDGIQQALEYAVTLNIQFVFSSNGDGFVFHDRTGTSAQQEANLALDAFPSPDDLWAKYRAWKGLTPAAENVFLQESFEDGSDSIRVRELVASARNVPAFRWAAKGAYSANTDVTCPPSSALIAGAPPA